MGLTLPCPGGEVQAVAGAAGRLREFRERLRGCLTARGDALFELADAVLCSDRPVRSLVQLSLEPEFRRATARSTTGWRPDSRCFRPSQPAGTVGSASSAFQNC